MTSGATKVAVGAAVLASCGALILVSTLTGATDIDPTRPTTIVVGPSPGIAPMARVDSARRGRARDPLPRRPRLLWRQFVRGNIDLIPLAVDARGAVLVASASVHELLQLSAAGQEQWRASTGAGTSITGTVLLSDETRLIVTSAGDAIGFSPAGAIRFKTPLEAERNVHVSLLPLEDGGAAIAAGQEIDRMDGDGQLRDRVRFDEKIFGPLLATRSGILAVTQSGAVHLVRSGFSQRIGSLGGDPGEPGASTPDGRTLFAVVDHQRVMALDLTTGIAQARYAVTDLSLHGPIVFGRGDAAILISWNGVLMSIPKAGGEVRRTPLESRVETLVTDGGKVDFSALEDSPAAVTDNDGFIAFARIGGKIGVISPEGAASLAVGRTCHSPAALAPAGVRRMVVACRDGAVLMFGEDNP
jgi:hypothetical protein